MKETDDVQKVLHDLFQQLSAGKTAYADVLESWRQLHETYLETAGRCLQEWAQQYQAEAGAGDQIAASEVVVEVMDQATGHLARRTLPIDFRENDNGVVLSGETADGTPSQIVLLSGTALDKIRDLIGGGPDASRCDGHDHG